MPAFQFSRASDLFPPPWCSLPAQVARQGTGTSTLATHPEDVSFERIANFLRSDSAASRRDVFETRISALAFGIAGTRCKSEKAGYRRR